MSHGLFVRAADEPWLARKGVDRSVLPGPPPPTHTPPHPTRPHLPPPSHLAPCALTSPPPPPHLTPRALTSPPTTSPHAPSPVEKCSMYMGCVVVVPGGSMQHTTSSTHAPFRMAKGPPRLPDREPWGGEEGGEDPGGSEGVEGGPGGGGEGRTQGGQRGGAGSPEVGGRGRTQVRGFSGPCGGPGEGVQWALVVVAGGGVSEPWWCTACWMMSKAEEGADSG